MARQRKTFYRTGDWGKARRTLNGLHFKLRAAADKGMQEEAEAAVRRVKNNIWAQNYDHAPLSDWQETDKAKKGQDSRTLIADKDYVRSIESFKMGKNEYGIGFQDEEMGNRAKLLEFGGTNNLGRHVPERPHFRVELERIRSGKIPNIRKAMQAVLRGQQTMFDIRVD